MATDNKYDRQLRLWGSEGQRLLSTSRVLMIGSSAVSSEVLKNLVLPGVGFFSIADNKEIKDSDLGENFFVHSSKAGQPRAEVVKDYLLELNPDVAGESVSKSFEEILLPGFIESYDLVIACQVTFDKLFKLAEICEEKNKKLIVCRSVGLIGYVRVYCNESLVVESKPSDKELYDYRLHKPFEELERYCDSVNIDSLESIYHSHVPFIVILLNCLKEWKGKHLKQPETFDEKQNFKEFIRSKSKDYYQEMNFQEAVNKAYLCFIKEDLPEEVIQILSDEKSVNADQSSPVFWKCAKSVNQFMKQFGVPPLTGLFSDMTSDTNSYITLQSIYSSKALADLQSLSEIYKSLFPAESVPEDLSNFSKNLLTLETTRYQKITEELQNLNSAVFEDPEEIEYKLVDWYLALRVIDSFVSTQGKWPASDDYEALQSSAEALGKRIETEILEEVIRYKDSEIHTVSALTAGVASQESVKLLTKQYSSINNTFIFTGTTSHAGVLQL